jgi:multidrug efflux system membrane fusion protein
VQRGPQGTFVYIVTPEQTATLRTVQVETVQEQWAIIKSGLQPGDKVVIEGQNQLRPGAKVALRASAAGHTDEGAPGTPDSVPDPNQPGAGKKGKRGGAAP